jgi:hypothetical protein
MCEEHDHISDIESITVSGRWYVVAIRISIHPMIEDCNINLPMEIVIPITGLENCVTL